jgi:hypothetical protein
MTVRDLLKELLELPDNVLDVEVVTRHQDHGPFFVVNGIWDETVQASSTQAHVRYNAGSAWDDATGSAFRVIVLE